MHDILADIRPVSPKVEKLYDAVCLLLEEGRDINTLKVSEITEKAGIGKGTAYEYFKTKEEMIVKAIIFGMIGKLKEVEERASRCNTFREKYLAVLDWIEENFCENGSTALICRMAQESLQISAALSTKMHEYGAGPDFMLEKTTELVRGGILDGTISSPLPEKLVTSFVLSSFVTFWLYLTQNPPSGEVDRKRLKEFLYESLERTLGGL